MNPEPDHAAHLEPGRLGRLCTVRLRPNQDLAEGIEALCREMDLSHAVVRAAVGSLNDAVFEAGGRELKVAGPGLEIILLSGEITSDTKGAPRANLFGAVCDAEGQVTGGRFLPGRNIICITLELLLQEWLPDGAAEPTTPPDV